MKAKDIVGKKVVHVEQTYLTKAEANSRVGEYVLDRIIFEDGSVLTFAIVEQDSGDVPRVAGVFHKAAKGITPVERTRRYRDLLEELPPGWKVELKPYCEDAETPGWLGMYAGVCCHDRKAIKLRTAGRTIPQIIAAFEHELEHARGAKVAPDRSEHGLRCGGTRGAL